MPTGSGSGSYIPYSGGPAVINRDDNSSPVSPGFPIQGFDAPLTPDLPAETPTTITASPGSKVQVKIKIQYNNDKLAMIVPYNIAYTQLIDRVERKVRICGHGPELPPSTPIRIKYQDEDGDFISMNSDDDVQMAFEIGCEGMAKESGGTCGSVTLYVQVG